MDSASFIKNRNLRRNIKAYWVLIIMILGLMTYYSYFQFGDLIMKSEAIASQQAVLSNLETDLMLEQKDLEEVAKLKSSLDETLANDLALVFPESENYTTLTRELDAFFQDLGSDQNPIFVSNLQYGGPRLDSEGNFGILPITLTITSSKDNFFKFLNYIETSGTLTNKVRLMDVQSIKINFQKGERKLSSGEVSLNVSVNAYFQKPAEETDEK